MTAEESLGLIALCVLSTVAIKALGPVILGSRSLPAWSSRVIALLAPALFAALVVTQTLSDDGAFAVDERALGVAAGGLLAWRGVPLVVCIAVAAVVTAALRGGG